MQVLCVCQDCFFFVYLRKTAISIGGPAPYFEHAEPFVFILDLCLHSADTRCTSLLDTLTQCVFVYNNLIMQNSKPSTIYTNIHGDSTCCMCGNQQKKL